MHLLAHPTDVRRHHRQAERQRLHQRDRQPLPLRRQREDVAGTHHPHGVVTEPGEDHPIAEAEVVAELAGLGLLRALADGDEPHRHLTVGEQPRRLQQVRDSPSAGGSWPPCRRRSRRAPIPSSARTTSRSATALAVASTSMPCCSVSTRFATGPDIDSRTSSVTANDTSSQRLVNALSQRVGPRCVAQRLCSVLTSFGRSALRIVRVARRATEPGSGEWTCTMSHSPSRTSSARRNGQRWSVRLRLRQWVFTPGPLELLGQMVLPRQHVGALDVEALAVVRTGRSTQQPLGSTRPEPLDHPEHTSRHSSQGSADAKPPSGDPPDAVGDSVAAWPEPGTRAGLEGPVLNRSRQRITHGPVMQIT